MTGSRGLMRLLGALLVVNSLLMVPHWILEGGLGPRWFALEAWFLVALSALLPRSLWSRVLAWVAATLLVATLLVDLGDVAARKSLARPLNLYLDIHLVSAVRHLLEGTLGVLGAAVVFLVGIGALFAAVWGVARLLTPPEDRLTWARLRAGAGAARLRAGAAATLLAFAAVGVAGDSAPDVVETRVALPVIRTAVEQSRSMGEMLEERERFEAALAGSPSSYRDRDGLLAGLGGRDVTLAFVESYGMSALEDPRYAPVLRPRLEAMEAALDSVGLTLATGRLLAPSQGGQSWFGHGSMLSGLWLDNQLRYDLLLASDRETLVDDFEHAGYRTAAIMPAITLAWPEGTMLGYDAIYDRDRIDYGGPPLNWVTMPDQFTWSFLERRVRPEAGGRPLFAELGLISSHAPWTPILPVLDDWDGVGDGRVFERWADAGETPRELWSDADRVREHYARSVEYAVHVAQSYAVRYVGDEELLVILGDHQPAPLITGDGASRAVPVHVVSGDPELIRPFLTWGFQPGAFPPNTPPSPERPLRRMDDFRSWFVEAFSP